MAKKQAEDLPAEGVVIDLGMIGEPGSAVIKTPEGSFSLGALLRRLVGKGSPQGRTGERDATKATHYAILRYVHDIGITDCWSGNELVRRAAEHASRLKLPDADLVNARNGNVRDIANKSLEVLRLPEPD